jgi:hypothetical protein
MGEPVSLFPRREPCPCGSGKRFKNCCDGIVTINVDVILAAEDRFPGFIKSMSDGFGADLEMRVDRKAKNIIS